MRIDYTGDALQIARKRRRQPVGVILIGSRYPDIDRRRLAEVQYLIDDIGRLEEELQRGETLGKVAPEPRHQRCGGCVLWVQRDKNISVHRTDRRRSAERDDHAARAHTDIVEDRLDLVVADEGPDRGLDAAEIRVGLLDPGPGRSADVKLHLAGVHL